MLTGGSGVYRRKLDQSTAHPRGVKACYPAFSAPAPVPVPGRQCKTTLRQNRLIFLLQNNVTCAFIGQLATRHVLDSH